MRDLLSIICGFIVFFFLMGVLSGPPEPRTAEQIWKEQREKVAEKNRRDEEAWKRMSVKERVEVLEEILPKPGYNPYTDYEAYPEPK